MATSIYEFNSFAKFLNATYRSRKAQDESFTYKAFANELGITSSLLTLIASGRRRTTADVLGKLSRALGFDDDQMHFAELLAQRDRASSAADEAVCDTRIRIYREMTQHALRVEGESLSCFTHWYLIAILEMTGLPDFSSDPTWISKRLGDKIDVETARNAFKRLVELGYLARNADGRWQPQAYLFKTEQDTPIAIVRSYYEQMLELTREALREHPVDERFVNGLTINIEPRQLPAARKVMQKAIAELIRLCGETPGTETYHLGVQLFRLTETEARQPSNGDPH